MMQVRMLAKDQGSGNGGCPAVYLADNGELVLQGQAVDADTFSNLANVLPGERAVRLSPATVLAAVEAYCNEGSL